MQIFVQNYLDRDIWYDPDLRSYFIEGETNPFDTIQDARLWIVIEPPKGYIPIEPEIFDIIIPSLN